jgi:RNA polymerase sigma-70 factor (ECF subfamily)
MSADIELLCSLMERYSRGESAVFEQLYRVLAPPLYRFCLRLTTRRSEADDCFQETFLKLHRARSAYVPGANALSWAFAIARSIYLTRLRYWRARPENLGSSADIAESLDLQSTGTPEEEVQAEKLFDVVTTELRRMSEKNRAAYILLKEECVSAEEAAAILGTTVDAVKQRAHRANLQVRAAVESAG